MANRLTWSVVDYDQDKSQVSFENSAILTGANYDATESLANALVTALIGITDGNQRVNYFGNYGDTGVVSASDPEAQAHVQFVLKYKVTATGQLFQKTIGTANLELTIPYISPDGKTYAILDPASAEYIALKAAFDAYQMEGANACELLQVFVRE